MSINEATPEMWDRLRTKYAAIIMEDEVTKEEKKEGVGVFPTDNVNNPEHYNTGNIECIDAIEESMSSVAFKGYLKGNCMKYLWRYDYKGKQVEDLHKAQWYLAKLLQQVVLENEGCW